MLLIKRNPQAYIPHVFAISLLAVLITTFFYSYDISLRYLLKDVDLEDEITLSNESISKENANSSCVIVSCASHRINNMSEHFWNYYKGKGYSVRLFHFDMTRRGGYNISPLWCRIPALRATMKEMPTSRPIYIDIDTLVNVRVWCDLPLAPIVMNSLHRHAALATMYTRWVSGSQVQSNAVAVMPGRGGLRALRRWEMLYSRKTHDQGVIHAIENGMCGIPGWIHCYSNPEQQRCHCTGSEDKNKCIEDLFSNNSVCARWLN